VSFYKVYDTEQVESHVRPNTNTTRSGVRTKKLHAVCTLVLPLSISRDLEAAAQWTTSRLSLVLFRREVTGQRCISATQRDVRQPRSRIDRLGWKHQRTFVSVAAFKSTAYNNPARSRFISSVTVAGWVFTSRAHSPHLKTAWSSALSSTALFVHNLDGWRIIFRL